MNPTLTRSAEIRGWRREAWTDRVGRSRVVWWDLDVIVLSVFAGVAFVPPIGPCQPIAAIESGDVEAQGLLWVLGMDRPRLSGRRIGEEG